ncbi:MAG: hypothetical protein MZU91_04830 [Desulfosudis oleivorans]|nr:hypothetical protein [Desulfosudis oleivorans]
MMIFRRASSAGHPRGNRWGQGRGSSETSSLPSKKGVALRAGLPVVDALGSDRVSFARPMTLAEEGSLASLMARRRGWKGRAGRPVA